MAIGKFEYIAHSLIGGAADLGASNTAGCRKEIADDWDRNQDVVGIYRVSDNAPMVGYVVFNRTRDIYLWVSIATGICRKFDPKTGKLGAKTTLPAKPKALIEANIRTYKNKIAKTKATKPDFTKISSAGIPIYKIWYSPLMESYDVLGRKKSGEWVYGRDYDLKKGIWQGGKYDYDIDNLYKRVGGTYPVLYKNNRRGKTGRF